MHNKEYEQFSTMPLPDHIRQAIAGIGFEIPTPIQKLVLPDAVAGKDILGQAQTGTGKTLAFAIPIVTNTDGDGKYVQALVMTPTRELAKQVTGEVEKISMGSSIRVVSVYGGVSMQKQISALRGGAQVVVGTPGRIWDLIRQKELKLDRVKIAVLDEVDEMLDMGFQEDVEIIFSKLPAERQTMLFSATIPPRIQRLGRTHLKRPVIHSTSDDNVVADTTEHVFYEVLERERFNRLCDIVDAENVRLGLVFCRTKMETDRVHRNLVRRGYSAEALHGDLPQPKREQVMKKYRDGSLDLLIATNVAARGIDVQGVSHVINYHIPLDAEVYVHRTGRTGRAGSYGQSITFVSPSEYYDLMKIQETNNIDIVKRELPDRDAVFEKRMERMLDKIKNGMQKENLRDAYKLVKKSIPFTWRGRALAYLVKKYIDNGYNFLDAAPEAGREAGSEEGVRLFVNVGKNHGADPASLTDFLVKSGKIGKKQILKVDVLERFSFINVASGTEKDLIKNLSGSKFDKYSVKVEESRARGTSGGGRRSSRGDGPRRRSSGSRSSSGRPASRRSVKSSGGSGGRNDG